MLYLLLGSNMGNRVQILQQAACDISSQVGNIEKVSLVYESEAWGFECPENFLNQVLVVSSHLSAVDILRTIQAIENNAGRVRSKSGYEARTLDIDILFYNNELIDTPELIVPHPRMHLRRFTLEPMCNVAPLMIHPLLKQTMQQLLQQCTDVGKVWVHTEY